MQKILEEGYELRKSLKKGEGIFSTKVFDVGETVMIGKIKRRFEKNHSHASQIGKNEYVFHAGLISKVNHSCDPNCGIKVNETGAHDFVAIRGIVIGEEITFDYAMRNYSIDFFPQKCMCGAKKCREFITGWKDLSNELKEKYKKVTAPYIFDIENE